MKNFIIALLLLIPVSMFADVEIHETYNNSFGFMGTKGARTIYIKNNLERVDEEYEMTGEFAMMMSKGKIMKAIRIVDLGKKIIYNINPDKEVYSVSNISGIEAMDSLYSSDSINATFDYKIQDMNESKIINGFKANHYIATMKIIGGDKKDTLKIIDNMWVSKNVPEWETIKNYNRLMKTSFSKGRKGKSKNKNIEYMNDFYEKIAKIEGYSVKSDISMFTSVSNEDDNNNGSGVQLNNLISGNKKDANKSGNGYRMFHSLTEVKSIEKKQLDDNLFKLKNEWKEVGN